jgi:hypothetical protein
MADKFGQNLSINSKIFLVISCEGQHSCMRGLVIHREAYYEKILCTRWNKMRSSSYQSPVRVGHILLKCWTAGTVGNTDRHAPVINALQFYFCKNVFSIVYIIACIVKMDKL